MITITADAALLAALRQADGPAEVRDADGNVVGISAPVAPEHAEAAARMDWEELERRARSTGGTHPERNIPAPPDADDR